MGLTCGDARSITLPMKKLQVLHDHLVSEGGLEPLANVLGSVDDRWLSV
jgi:hypothetical protein